MNYEVNLERILTALNLGEATDSGDWEAVFNELKGHSDAETILNVQDFIIKNFSFEIETGAEGWAYYGGSEKITSYNDAPIFKYIDAIVRNEPNKYGYISSTQAGKLFNNDAFNMAFQKYMSKNKKFLNKKQKIATL